MHVVGHQVPFLYPALFLQGQSSKHLAQVRPQLAEQHLPPAFRNEYDVVFATPVQDNILLMI
jgi:hypothetical protein